MNEQKTPTVQSRTSTGQLASLTNLMSKQQALLLVSRLLASYPGVTIQSPQVYMTELGATLMKFPFGTGERGMAKARAGSPSYPPSVGLIEAECEKLFGGTRETATYAQEWQARAAEQLGERAEIERAPRIAPRDERPPHNRASVFVPATVSQYAGMVAKAELKGTDPLDWYYGSREGRDGIWVSLGWVEKLMGGRRDSGLSHISRYGAPI